MYSKKGTENEPLLDKENISYCDKTEYTPSDYCDSSESQIASNLTESSQEGPVKRETVVLKKNITLFHAVFFIVTSATGAGIFISPAGVTEQVETVGASLLVWLFCGIFSLALAFCYCELGTAFPVAGGDYAFINIILGPLPAFLCLWVTVLLTAPVSATLMARTAAEYILEEFTLYGNETSFIILTTIFLNITFAALNTVSVKWTARALSILTVLKLGGILMVMIIGATLLADGNSAHLQNTFKGTPSSPFKFAAAILPAYVAYIGWDTVTTMAEEMKNPKRDLPLSTTIAMIIVTIINVFMNVSYFIVLTPGEFVQSNTVAVAFTNKACPQYTWMIPIFVTCSAVSAMIGMYLGYPRYTYAGGKNGQLPQVFSFIHMDWCSPFPAVILQCFISVILCSMPFLNLTVLLQIAGILMQIKAAITLVALLYVKTKWKHLKRAIEVPFVVVVMCLCLLLIILLFSVIEDPLVNGTGCIIFILGLPFYYIGKICSNNRIILKYSAKITICIQLLLKVMPTDISKTVKPQQ